MSRFRLLGAAILLALVSATAWAQQAETITITKATWKSGQTPMGTVWWLEVEGTYTGAAQLNEVRCQRLVGDPATWQAYGTTGQNQPTWNGVNGGTFKLDTPAQYIKTSRTIRVQAYRNAVNVSTSADYNVN